MAAISTMEKSTTVHTKVVREEFTVSRTEKHFELVLEGTERRIFRFTEQIDFPEVSFDIHDGRIFCMFTFIHDPNIKENTLEKLEEFKKVKEYVLYKSAAEAYEKGDKAQGNLKMKLAKFVSEMQYAEGADNPYEFRLMTLSTVSPYAEFSSDEVRDGMVTVLQEIGKKMKTVFEPKPFESRK